MGVNNVIREIVSHEKRMNPGHQKHWAVGGSITMVLADCGHQVSRKLSQGLPKTNRVRCPECTDLANGARIRTGNPDGTWTVWGWDYETNLPTKRIAPSSEQPQ